MTSSTRFIEMLTQGVLLEDRDLLLPWGATREELKALDAHYKERETADRWELVWPDCTVLNGVKIRLSAVFYTHSQEKILDRLGCDHLNDGTYESAKHKYAELKNHISQCCGQPAQEGTERATWEVPGAAINLYIWDHFDFFCALAFSKLRKATREQ